MDLLIGYVGLSQGPQNPRGPSANCGTHRVNCRYMISLAIIRQNFASSFFIKFSLIHLIRFRVDNTGVLKRVSMNLSLRFRHGFVIMQQIKNGSISKYTTSVNTEDDATNFLRHSRRSRFCPSPLQYTIYKVLSFHRGLTLHLMHIGLVVCKEKIRFV